MTIRVGKSEINKDIYFLHNTNYTDKKDIRHYHDNLKELDNIGECETKLRIYYNIDNNIALIILKQIYLKKD